MNRKEFVAQLTVPTDTTQAYNLGRSSARYGKLSEREFFRNDVSVRIEMYPTRASLYNAYKIGRRNRLREIAALEQEEVSA